METLITYKYVLRNKYLAIHAKSVADLKKVLQDQLELVENFKKADVTWDFEAANDDYIIAFTQDQQLAAKYGFIPESSDR
jgi:UDP-N-acetylglucosamine pyrophosphorylase